jgi:hypothetical protein
MLPFLQEPSMDGATGALFREPAVLLQLGWAPAQIRAGCKLVPLPSDRELYADLQGLARVGRTSWSQHRSVRTIQGHKQRRVVEVTAAAGLTSWAGFVEAARA